MTLLLLSVSILHAYCFVSVLLLVVSVQSFLPISVVVVPESGISGRRNDNAAINTLSLRSRELPLSYRMKYYYHSRRTLFEIHAATDAGVELWLDLRGTKLTPTTALKRLQQDLNQLHLVDRIVMEQGNVNINDDDDDDMIILIQKNPQNQQTIIHGLAEGSIVVNLAENGILEDPLTPMSVVSNGGWVLMESKFENVAQRQDGISSLLELMAGGTSAMFGDAPDDSSRSSSSSSGGVAWVCSTKSDVLHAGTAMASLQKVESTLSGILLSAAPSSGTGENTIQCALLLPFDELVWKTAIMLFRSEDLFIEDEFDLE